MAVYLNEANIDKPDFLNRTGGQTRWHLRSLNHVTVLFGRNGSGKSILLRRLRETNRESAQYISPERGGEFSHDVNLMQEELGPNRGNSRMVNFAGRYRQEAVSRIQSLQLKLGQIAGKGGVVHVYIKDLEQLLNTLLPDFEFDILDSTPPLVIRRLSNRETVSSGALSSGEAEMLALGVDIVTTAAIWELEAKANRVLCIDEPDAHLHPDLQQHLAHFLIDLADKYNIQMIIATHSTTLLSALGYHGKSKTSVIYLDNSIVDQEAVPFDDALQELSTCLGGHALMGPLFAAPILLVEGDDEFKIWSQVPRYNRIRLVALPCGGEAEVKRFQKILERLFKSLLSPARILGFALLDHDIGLPIANETNTQDFVKFVSLACHESENLYLTDEVLADVGTSWVEAQNKIKAESANYGDKAEALRACDSWDRKSADIKPLIKQLVQILDSKNVPWTLRVAKCIGTPERPTGQIADFLGENLINELWGVAPQTVMPPVSQEEVTAEDLGMSLG